MSPLPRHPDSHVHVNRSTKVPSLRSKLVSGVKTRTVLMGLIFLVHFGAMAVLARLLSPTEIGEYAYALLVTEPAIVLAQFGLTSALVSRGQLDRHLTSAAFLFSLLIGVIVSMIVWLAVPHYFAAEAAAVTQWMMITVLVRAVSTVSEA